MVNKNTFCVAPWNSIFINSDKKIAPCCKFRGRTYDYKDMEEYYHSKELNKVRQDLLDGIKNPHCRICWDDEEKGGDSQRLISNRTSVKGTSVPFMDQIKHPNLDNVTSFDLTLGNLCNLKCVMCTP